MCCYLCNIIFRCSGFNFTMCYVCTCNCEDEIVIFIATKVFLQGIIVVIQRMQNMKECIVGSLLKYQLKFFCNTIRVHGITVEPRLVDPPQ